MRFCLTRAAENPMPTATIAASPQKEMISMANIPPQPKIDQIV